MPEIQKYSLKEELGMKDKELQDSPALYGMTSLTWSRYINSMRSTMYTSHLKQFLTPLKPDFPFLFTNAENLVGKQSSGYKKVKNESVVYRKCTKYEDILETPNIYTLFYFDNKLQQYEVTERKEVEDLTENFGYQINNDFIDSLEEGDIIEPDSILYHSTSYDEYGNYRFGKNAVVMYTLEPYTSEDAAGVRKGFSDQFTTVESEVISIKMSDNDYLLNLRGKNGEYKPLPDVGECVTGILASMRTQFNNQLLYDFKADSLGRIQDGDRSIYVNGTQEITDITIYNNSEELDDSPFNTQIHKYLKSQNKYYKKIYSTCKEIIESGEKYSRDIDYLFKRSKEMLDTKKRWKEGDAAPSKMIIEISIRKVRPLSNGQKITGRYGNKSVISKVIPDEEMPYTEDGRQVDVMLNLLAIINRTTSMAIYELIITAICYQTRKRMKTFRTYKQKENLLFDMIYDFNEEQYAVMKPEYDKLSDIEKKRVIDDTIDDGIYIHISPTHETTALFYRIRNILAKNEWLQPENVYINKYGRRIKTMSKHWIGEMYLLKLKQSDFRGFSARSTGAIDTKGLPTRSYKSRNHMERHSDSSIRFGEFETLNFSIGVPSDDIALFHSIYRTSIKGREDLVKLMFKMNNVNKNGESEGSIDNAYTSRVAEIFKVIFKSLSLEISFEDDDDVLNGYDTENITMHELNGQSYLCTDYQFFLMKQADDIKNEILSENIIMSDEELQKEIERRLRENKFLNGRMYDDEGNIMFE